MATVRSFESGSPEETGNALDFFIDGDAFFMVQGPTGDINYTRDGSFKISITDMGKMLTTSDGYAVLDEAETPIYIDFDLSDLIVSQNGELSYIDEEGLNVHSQVIGSYFENRTTEAIGRNLIKATQGRQPVMAQTPNRQA